MIRMAAILGCFAATALGGSPLTIHLERDWQAPRADVLKVLHSAADPLWRELPDRDLSPIKVYSTGGPIVLYARDDDGSYVVKLDTSGTYWAQQAYQFSHEFCHIVSGYKEGGVQNKWFEETLCELASIYSLRRMATEWEIDPPYPNWKSYGEKLRLYAQNIIDETKVPADLAGWWVENCEVLRERGDDRMRNRVVAVRLLPVFEKSPELWSAIRYVNRGDQRDSQDFAGFLQNWYDQAPRRFGPNIAEIAGIFGVVVK